MVDLTALPGTLDLFELLVNYVFGGILLAIIGWAVVLAVTLIIGRVSMVSFLVIIATYLTVAMVGYFGAIMSVGLFIGAMIYMMIGVLNWWNNIR